LKVEGQGAHSILVASTNDDATLRVAAGGSGGSTISVISGTNGNASMQLGQHGDSSFQMRHVGADNSLEIGKGDQQWLTISGHDGTAMFKNGVAVEGDLRIGEDTNSASSELQVHSASTASISLVGAAATMTVESTAAQAQLKLLAGGASSASVELANADGHSFSIVNNRSSNRLEVQDGESTLLAVALDGLTVQQGLRAAGGQFVVQNATGHVGIGLTSPQTALHVNGSVRIDQGSLNIADVLVVNHTSRFVGVNTPSSAADSSNTLAVTGNVEVKADSAGVGGNMHVTGAIHLGYAHSASGATGDKFFVAAQANVTLPSGLSSSCTQNCAPTGIGSRIYMIRNKATQSGTSVWIQTGVGSSTVNIRKNGGDESKEIKLEPYGMAMCAYDLENVRYDCWSWGEN